MVTLRVNGLKISLVNTSRSADIKTKTPRTFKQNSNFCDISHGNAFKMFLYNDNIGRKRFKDFFSEYKKISRSLQRPPHFFKLKLHLL